MMLKDFFRLKTLQFFYRLQKLFKDPTYSLYVLKVIANKIYKKVRMPIHKLDPYQVWLSHNHPSRKIQENLLEQLQIVAQTQALPLFSIIMPVFNPPLLYLEKAIESVKKQKYSHWELCIADDKSQDPTVSAFLQQYAAADSRIKITLLEQNSNISLASNAAAALATGKFLVFLDQDDELAPDALLRCALYIHNHPNTDYLYSDSDKITADGKRYDPHFKPDWSPELLLSYMYCGQLICINHVLFKKIGGFRAGFEGSQDYDLAIRATEQARHIGHIPLVLYHWRSLPTSTASSTQAKPNSIAVGKLAITEALQRRNINATVIQPRWAEIVQAGIFSFQFPDQGPSVTLIIPTYNKFQLLKKCVESLKKTTYQNYQIIIIDNNSNDPDTLEFLKNCGHTVLKIGSPNGKFNYSYLNNEAVKKVSTEYVLFLNNDTEVITPQWLSQMMGYMQFPGVGAVGARLSFPFKKIQHAGIIHGLYNGLAGPAFRLLPQDQHGYHSHASLAKNYSAVTGACLLTRKALFVLLGGFDEKKFSIAYNDVDYCYRLHEQSYRIVFCPEAELIHHEGKTRGINNDSLLEISAFKNTYKNKVDPFYNRNLSLERELFEINNDRNLFQIKPNKPIKLLVCTHNLNWEGAPLSQFELIIRMTKTHQIVPVVHSRLDGPLRQRYEQQGIKVWVASDKITWHDDKAYEEKMRNLVVWIKQLNVDVVYANTLLTFYMIDAAKRAALPSLWNIRESEKWPYFNSFLINKKLIRKAINCLSYSYKTIFVADATRKLYEAANAKHSFMTIPNALNPARFNKQSQLISRTELRKEFNIKENDIVILEVGTVCKRKGQMDLVKALKTINKEVLGNTHVFIIGDRPSAYSKKMHAIVNSYPPSVRNKIKILPEIDNVADYYSVADIFVCSSRVESYPRVILEAMHFGLPIVTTPVFGIVEQVKENINALFYLPGHIKVLANHLQQLITNHELRQKLRQGSSDVATLLLTFDEMVNKYATVFEEASFQ